MFRSTRSVALSLALSLALTACGGGEKTPAELVTEGGRALGSNDYAAALASFEELDAAIGSDSSNPLYMDAKKGMLNSLAGADPARAIAELEAMADDLGDNLNVKLYNGIASRMSGAGHFDEAVEVIGLATARFGKSDELANQAAQISTQAKSAGVEGIDDAMAGLGYVGND